MMKRLIPASIWFFVGCVTPAEKPPVPTYSAATFFETTTLFGASFSADESRLLVSSDETGIFNVLAIPVDGSASEVLTQLQQLRFVMDDGSEQSFDQVYKGFETHEKGRRAQFPFRKIGISGLVYDVLSVVFPRYDANENGLIEEPELTVLYLREGARGMGFKVSHLLVEERVVALQTSPADVRGLVGFINAHKAGMTKEARSLFGEIDYLTAQIQRRGVSAADQTFLGP